MTPKQCEGVRKKLGWSREQLAAKSGVPVYVIQRIERPTKLHHQLPDGAARALRQAFEAAGEPLFRDAVQLRILGLRALQPKNDGSAPRSQHVDVEVDGQPHVVNIKVSSGVLKLPLALFVHPRADEIREAVLEYLRGLPVGLLQHEPR